MALRAQPKAVESHTRMATVHSLKRTTKNTLFEFFFPHYYDDVAPEDVAARTTAQREAIAKAHWQAGLEKVSGKPVIYVYNPEETRDGWYSRCTVIDIVTDDMPFLVDSVRMEVNRQGYAVNVIVHPIYRTLRDKGGKLQCVAANYDENGPADFEAYMHIEIARQTDPEALQALEQGLHKVLADVRYTVNDWRKMRTRLRQTIEAFDQETLPVKTEEVTEARAFLEWLDSNHFTFIGCRDYEFITENSEEVLRIVPRSGLGILRSPDRRTLSTRFAAMPAEIRKQIKASELLVITKASTRSTIHRPGHLDYIGIKRFNSEGKVIGERRFLGLYTSTAYRKSPRDVPYLRDKIASVIAKSKLNQGSHSGKALLHILETYPRDELFQISVDDLYRISTGIVHLGESQRVKLFVRNDRFLRFISCLVYMPRDKYNTDMRVQIFSILSAALDSQDIVFNVNLSDDAMARIEFLVKVDPGNFPKYNADEIEQSIIAASHSWDDRLRSALHKACGEEEAYRLFSEWQPLIPVVYKADFSPELAVEDIRKLQSLNGQNDLCVKVREPGPNQVGVIRLRLYKSGDAIPPSDSLPILENMGTRVLDQVPYPFRKPNGETIWMHDNGLAYVSKKKPDIEMLKNFEETFQAVWQKQIESDGFNQLVLKAGLTWRQVTIIRGYCKYLLQTTASFSQAYMEAALVANPAVVKMLIELFTARFEPAAKKGREQRMVTLEKKIEKALDEIASLDEDRILRNFLAVVKATIRTNYYQMIINSQTGDAEPKPYVSFKFDSANVPDLPDPRPMYEIFVYSPRVEGVHLRSSKVARGGLRWSDRREDFRTEVLGLVKAQKVKNAVIVPDGAKGGFYVKQPPVNGDREMLMQEVVNCYTDFICGLLDITDNIKDGKTVPPVDVIRYDEDDSYLVVAADKGTATFSDLANSIAQKYDFWLGDAFASGGSNGYDHKKMGITARGGWESVKLLFRDLGKNIQEEDFTVVGIGDMAGDVFGNGMLLSKHIKLVAAFNHMHIFIDPSPDPEKSHAERDRLFHLPRSTWADYNEKLISGGGGIFPRNMKSILLSPQAKDVLGIKENALSPTRLINAILKAPVELIWNGGIGTYVKASTEQHTQAGDRANDAVRVDANELRCKVMGEGGNLGLTQRARIEFARSGGRIDTDFIHNSGGVDCSDREVNIKILLNALKSTAMITENQRVKLLAEMTDEVADFVLHDNYWQGQAITQIEAEAPKLLDEHVRFIKMLEHRGTLKRRIEALPNDEEILERKAAGEGLTRPEIAVLVSYAKMTLFSDLVESDLWSDAYFSNELVRYFPKRLRKRYADQMHAHQLRREILATFIANRMVNRMGSTFAFVLQEETGATPAEIVRAYTIAWETFRLRDLWAAVVALNNKVPCAVQTQIMLEGVKLMYRASKWLLRNRRRALGVIEAISAYDTGARSIETMLPRMFEKSQDENIIAHIQHYLNNGLDKGMALHVTAMDAFYATFDIVEISKALNQKIEAVIEMYFRLSAYFSLFWLRVRIRSLTADNRWQHRANVAMFDDLYDLIRKLTTEVLRFTIAHRHNVADTESSIAAWHKANEAPIDRYQQVINDLKLMDHPDHAMISVTLREMQNMLRAVEA